MIGVGKKVEMEVQSRCLPKVTIFCLQMGFKHDVWCSKLIAPTALSTIAMRGFQERIHTLLQMHYLGNSSFQFADSIENKLE